MTIIFPSHKSLYKDHRNFNFITYISTNELEQHNTCMYEKKKELVKKIQIGINHQASMCSSKEYVNCFKIV